MKIIAVVKRTLSMLVLPLIVASCVVERCEWTSNDAPTVVHGTTADSSPEGGGAQRNADDRDASVEEEP